MATEAATRAALYRLIDELPEAELHAARRYLEYLAHGADQVDAGTTGDAASGEPSAAVHDADYVPGLRAPVAEDPRLRDAVRHVKAQDSATMTEAADVEIRWLDDEDSRALFEEQARTLVGISGEEFLRRWDTGDYDAMADDPNHPEIMRLAALIPFGR